jgi:predicted transposase YbfD/YdcC
LVLGQLQVGDASNEIAAIPRLLDVLEMSGCLVTIDAIGCQQDIAKQIVEHGADYVLAVKGNQGSLLREARQCFETLNVEGMRYFETQDQAHGRTETRRYWMTEQLPVPLRRIQWAGLRSFGMVEGHRTVGDTTSGERRYYISSLPANAQR